MRREARGLGPRTAGAAAPRSPSGAKAAGAINAVSAEVQQKWLGGPAMGPMIRAVYD